MVDLPFGANATRRVPTAGEASTGFPCGAADQSLFNFLAWLSSRNAIPTSVNSATTSAEPGSPAAGDAYIIPDGATGTNWSGQADKVAMWTGADWVFWNVSTGTLIMTADTAVVYMRTVSGWLAYPIVQVIREDTTKTIGTGTGDDFETFSEAFLWLSNYRIAVGYTVTFEVGAESFTLDGSDESLRFDHPDKLRVQLIGADLSASFPAAGAWAAAGGDSTNRAADLATNKTLAQSVFATEVYCDNDATVDFLGGIGKVKNIGFFGDGSNVDGVSVRYGFAELENVVALGFGSKNIAIVSAFVGCINVVGVGGADPFSVLSGGQVTCTSGYMGAFGGSGGGFTASFGSAVNCTSGFIIGSGNAQVGVHATKNSHITCGTSSATAVNNTSVGFQASSSSRVECASSSSTGSSNAAYYATEHSSMDARSTTGSGGYLANRGSDMEATSGTAGTLSPTANTIGNENSYIYQ